MFTAIIIKSIIIWKHEEGRGHGRLPPLLVLKLSPDALFVNYCLSHLAVDRIKWLNVVKDNWEMYQFSLVQFSRLVMSDSLWPHGLQHTRTPCPSLTPGVYSNSFPLSQWCHPTISSSAVPFSFCLRFPSISVFSSESALLIRWSKYWNFSFNISLSSEYSGLTSLRMDWLDPLAVQGPLKSLLQHHRSKASVLWHSVFFIVQLSHPYMTTGKP